MPLTNYLDESLASLVFGSVPFTTPTTLYVGLSTTVPTQAQGSTSPFWNFTEPVGGGYSRVTVANTLANFVGAPIANGYQIGNASIFTFPTASTAWGTITYSGIFDAAVNGNLLCYGLLSAPQTINVGDTASCAVASLSIVLN